MKNFFALFAVLACCCAALAAESPMDEQKFREQMGLEDYANVSYRDNGSPVDFQKFRSVLSKGKTFSMMKDPDKGIAILEVKDAPAVMAKDKYLVKRGERLPQPTLRDLDGKEVALQARAGRPLLINFFFAACAPCIAETPALNTFAAQHQDVDVVAITFDSPPDARKYVSKHGFKWPIVPQGQEFLDKLGIKSFPTFAYVGRDGKLLGMTQAGSVSGDGELEPEDLAKWIAKLAGQVKR